MKNKLVLSCEHASNFVPHEFRYLFEDDPIILNTHEAIDFGSFEMSEYLKKKLKVHLEHAEWCRLLVEPNRTENYRDFYSGYSSSISQKEKEVLVDQYYRPYRKNVLQMVTNAAQKGFVVHISVHSYSPVYDGLKREGDIGLLFDPMRKAEVTLCENWKKEMIKINPDIDIRYNYPYQGIEDGCTTWLRTIFSDKQYAGIEIEVNQKFFFYNEMHAINHLVKDSLKAAIKTPLVP